MTTRAKRGRRPGDLRCRTCWEARVPARLSLGLCAICAANAAAGERVLGDNHPRPPRR